MAANDDEGTLAADLSGVNLELPILRNGYLSKQRKGGRILNWQKRYFIINNDAVIYSKNPKDVPRGVIKMKEIIKVEELDMKKKHAFQICIDGREYVIAAETKEECTAWVQQIKFVLAALASKSAKSARVSAKATEKDTSSVSVEADKEVVKGTGASTSSIAFDGDSVDSGTMVMSAGDDVELAASPMTEDNVEPAFLKHLRFQREMAEHNAIDWASMSKATLEEHVKRLQSEHNKALSRLTSQYDTLRRVAQEMLAEKSKA